MNKEIRHELVTITPDMAREFLSHNTDNRHIRKAAIRTYAEDMENGRWFLTTDAIGFDKNGVLINGQHRLLACIEAGVSFQSFVDYGLDASAFSAIDNGVSRSASDGMRDVANASTAAACVKAAYAFRINRASQSDKMNKSMSLSNVRVNEIYNTDAEGYDTAVSIARSIYDKKDYMRAITPGQLSGMIYFLINDKGHDQVKVESFFRQILSFKTADNETLELLRIRLLNDSASPIKMTTTLKRNLITKAWNSFVQGRTLRVLKWNPDKEAQIKFA